MKKYNKKSEIESTKLLNAIKELSLHITEDTIFNEAFGGLFYEVEFTEDLDFVKGYESLDSIRLVSISDGIIFYDAAEITKDYFVFTCISNAKGGNTYFVPLEFKRANIFVEATINNVRPI